MKRVLLIAIAAVAVGLGSSEPGPAIGANEPPDRDTVARIQYLIEMLASKNRAPVVTGDLEKGEDEGIRFAEDYDKSLQVPVYLAVQQLLAEGEPALDLLLGHVGDDRNSFSVNFGNMDHNVTVSRACRDIADRILFSFDDELHVISRSQFGVYPKPENGDRSLAKWWAKNKRRGLLAIQTEAIDAHIASMKALDGRTASTTHPDASRLPLKEFNRLRDDNIRILKSIRRAIAETRQPYRAKSLDDQSRYMFGLPWTGRKHNK